jgi:hypothetical protein
MRLILKPRDTFVTVARVPSWPNQKRFGFRTSFQPASRDLCTLLGTGTVLLQAGITRFSAWGTVLDVKYLPAQLPRYQRLLNGPTNGWLEGSSVWRLAKKLSWYGDAPGGRS